MHPCREATERIEIGEVSHPSLLFSNAERAIATAAARYQIREAAGLREVRLYQAMTSDGRDSPCRRIARLSLATRKIGTTEACAQSFRAFTRHAKRFLSVAGTRSALTLWGVLLESLGQRTTTL